MIYIMNKISTVLYFFHRMIFPTVIEYPSLSYFFWERRILPRVKRKISVSVVNILTIYDEIRFNRFPLGKYHRPNDNC